MATKRNLKKDIDYLAYEVISDCLIFLEIKGEEKSEEIYKILNDTVELRNNLIARVNHIDGKDNPKLVKNHFNLLNKDLIEGIDAQFNKLSKIGAE